MNLRTANFVANHAGEQVVPFLAYGQTLCTELAISHVINAAAQADDLKSIKPCVWIANSRWKRIRITESEV